MSYHIPKRREGMHRQSVQYYRDLCKAKRVYSSVARPPSISVHFTFGQQLVLPHCSLPLSERPSRSQASLSSSGLLCVCFFVLHTTWYAVYGRPR